MQKRYRITTFVPYFYENQTLYIIRKRLKKLALLSHVSSDVETISIMMYNKRSVTPKGYKSREPPKKTLRL